MSANYSLFELLNPSEYYKFQSGYAAVTDPGGGSGSIPGNGGGSGGSGSDSGSGGGDSEAGNGGPGGDSGCDSGLGGCGGDSGSGGGDGGSGASGGDGGASNGGDGGASNGGDGGIGGNGGDNNGNGGDSESNDQGGPGGQGLDCAFFYSGFQCGIGGGSDGNSNSGGAIGINTPSSSTGQEDCPTFGFITLNFIQTAFGAACNGGLTSPLFPGLSSMPQLDAALSGALPSSVLTSTTPSKDPNEVGQISKMPNLPRNPILVYSADAAELDEKTKEICDDDVDNNDNGLVDKDDPQCNAKLSEQELINLLQGNVSRISRTSLQDYQGIKLSDLETIINATSLGNQSILLGNNNTDIKLAAKMSSG
jgi:hypothetical protein